MANDIYRDADGREILLGDFVYYVPLTELQQLEEVYWKEAYSGYVIGIPGRDSQDAADYRRNAIGSKENLIIVQKPSSGAIWLVGSERLRLDPVEFAKRLQLQPISKVVSKSNPFQMEL